MVSKNHYDRDDRFILLMKKFRRRGGSFRYADLLDVVRNETGFGKVKLNQELERLQSLDVCFYDKLDDVVHFRGEGMTFQDLNQKINALDQGGEKGEIDKVDEES